MNVVSYLKGAVPTWWALAWADRPGGRIAVLSTVWPHHGKRSGYSPVSKGLGMVLPEPMRLLPARISRLTAGDGLDKAYQIALMMKLTGRDQLFIIDGDFQLELIEGLRKVSNARIYAVFHQIPNVLTKYIAHSPRQLLDGSVCVARCQIPLVQSLAPPGRTWFIPHGVDTDYFTPCAQRSIRPVVLCVGYHCRSFEMLEQSAELIAQTVADVSVRLVAPRSRLPPKLGRVELMSGLSDEQLREEYRRAWVLLLPLTDATANNSLLEGMACGTPIVTTDVGGVRDYTGPECGALCPPGDAQAHGAATIALLTDPSRREAASRAARACAERYAWPAVRNQIRLILGRDEEKQS